MPMPTPKDEERKIDFLERFMDDEAMKDEYPDSKQRIAVAISQWEKRTFDDIRKTIDEIYRNVY